MQRTLTKLVTMQEQREALRGEGVPGDQGGPLEVPMRTSVITEGHLLVGCFYTWQMWHTATQGQEQFARADLKTCINIMIIAAGKDITIPAQHGNHDGISYRLWKQSIGTLAEELDKMTNDALGHLGQKGRSKTADSLRKRWRKLRAEQRSSFDVLCSAYILSRSNSTIVDHCTPFSHQWQAKYLK
ncbi:hypothetical protein PHMEG_00030038 [Phytophthora megakarya]|uniref:Uncharacterized protein n=1 Tax=Phytophthora megakarya TaxID=4795 RepID=A0A225V241_9STRA|nr:hypothetical protein PHMEG_00030038 [Phytophthora megakarya]